MPANLPPSYFEAERRYREARTPEGKVEALEEMLTVMPKHKGTDKLRADLRRKISKFKNQSQHKKGGPKRESVYMLEREGAAQIVLIGPPSSGKSSLLSRLSNAEPEIADFPHSTWRPTPGMVPYENIQFQLVDTPPITRDYVDPGLADLIRRSDMVILVLDLHSDPLRHYEESLHVLEGLRIFPEGTEIPPDLKKPPFLKRMIVLINKVDGTADDEDFEIFLELWESNLTCLPVSAKSGKGLDTLCREIFENAGIIRVFSKIPGKPPDYNQPFVLPRESTLEELAAKIHKDFVTDLKFARIWGESVFDGQMVQRDHVLEDGDVVEIHT